MSVVEEEDDVALLSDTAGYTIDEKRSNPFSSVKKLYT